MVRKQVTTDKTAEYTILIMGVELRNFQRKFQTLMGEVKPQIKPRIVVWLDERLAEFKIKGSMQLVETLEDPRWIKDYYTSKRESKEAAIKDREAREAGLSTPSGIQPKLEQKSESSNGIAHPDDISENIKEETVRAPMQHVEKNITEERDGTNPRIELVEVKREQVEDEYDDMIIVGESIAAPSRLAARPNRGTFSGSLRRAIKRRKSPYKMSQIKPNFRPASTATSSQSMFPSLSHTLTSQSPYVPTSQSYVDETQSYEEESPSYAGDSQPFRNELLRIPPHLQAEAVALQSQGQLDYEVTESDMYDEYGDESYDSSFLTEGESSIVYDEEGNAILKGENPDGSSMDPVPGTSDAASTSQARRRTLPTVVHGTPSPYQLSQPVQQHMLYNAVRRELQNTGHGNQPSLKNEMSLQNVGQREANLEPPKHFQGISMNPFSTDEQNPPNINRPHFQNTPLQMNSPHLSQLLNSLMYQNSQNNTSIQNFNQSLYQNPSAYQGTLYQNVIDAHPQNVNPPIPDINTQRIITSPSYPNTNPPPPLLTAQSSYTLNENPLIQLDSTTDDPVHNALVTRLRIEKHHNDRKPSKIHRSRTVFEPIQIDALEEAYRVKSYVNGTELTQLAKLLHLSTRQIKIWFQNRRSKDKRALKFQREATRKEEIKISSDSESDSTTDEDTHDESAVPASS